jgi:hypothetical protein
MADRRDTKLAQILGRLDGFCHPLHHGQIAIASGTFRTSTPRGFLPWTLSDDGPVPSRAVAMGRRPKPSQKRFSQGLPDCHGRAAGANQGWSTNVARREGRYLAQLWVPAVHRNDARLAWRIRALQLDQRLSASRSLFQPAGHGVC